MTDTPQPPAKPMLKPNMLRRALDEDKPSLGTHIMNSWPNITELVGHSGQFDYIEFVAEYAPYDLYAFENIARAVDLFPHMSSMIKVEQEPRTYLSVRAIGSGIQNVLFADPRTVADVEECVAAVRAEYPHNRRGFGRHGVGSRRDVGMTLEGGTPAYVEALDQAVCAIMIEKRQAVDDIQALLSVPGVDMVQFGPTDYAMSIGVPAQDGRDGTPMHPKVAEAERKVISTAMRMNVAVRAEGNMAADMVTRTTDIKYLDLGVKHFCIGTDVGVLYKYFTQEGAEMNKMLKRKPPCELRYGAFMDPSGEGGLGYYGRMTNKI